MAEKPGPHYPDLEPGPNPLTA